MPNREAIRKHLNGVLESLWDVDVILDQEIVGEDVRHLGEAVKAASREAIRIDATTVEEAWELKAMHDRLKSIQVALRILRNSTDRAELCIERALEHSAAIAEQVEGEEEDGQL